MFRRILIAVTVHPSSLAAARFAARLTKSQKGQLHACYVVDRSAVRAHGTLVGVREQLQEELEREGRRTLDRVKAVCRKLRAPYSDTLALGDVTEEVLKAVQRFRADLLVVATRGLAGVRPLLRGSVTPALVSRASCPVLLVRRATARRLEARRRRKKRAKRKRRRA